MLLGLWGDKGVELCWVNGFCGRVNVYWWRQIQCQCLRCNLCIGGLDEFGDGVPAQAFVQVNAQPILGADIGWYIKAFGVALGVVLLTARGHPQPQRQMAVAVVIDHVGCERFTFHAKVG